MDLSVTGGTLAGFLVAITAVVLTLIIVMKSIYTKRSASASAHTMSSASKSPLEARTKYPWADVFKFSGTFFNLGLVLALGLTVLAFSWTQYEDKVFIPDDALAFDEEIEIEPPRTAEPPPPPPPPPPPTIEEVPDEELLEEDVVEFVDQTVDQTTTVEAPPVKAAPPPPPPPPPPPKQEVEEIFKVVEDMPRFPGCEDLSSKEERKQCADKKMLEFIYKNIKYPAIARENGVEGTVVIQFVVEKNGEIKDAAIVRDIGAQCGQEALRVVNLMNDQKIKWIPGMQRGRAVRVQFNLPVKFRLE